ncbi:unnamed protein product, partial [Brenthis ino]
MNAHLKEAFARLKPICDMVMVSPSREHISPFIGVVCALNKEIIQELQQYMLFPFITHLQSKEIETKYELQEYLIFGMKEVLKKIRVNSFEMCMKIEMGLLSLVFEKPKPGMIADVPEELKLSVMQCLTVLMLNIDQPTRIKMVENQVPLLAQAVFVSVHLAKLEKHRGLRLAAINCLCAHTASHPQLTDKRCHITDPVLETAVVNMMSCILPGVLAALQDVATCSNNPGHAVVVAAINAIHRVLCLTMHNKHLNKKDAITADDFVNLLAERAKADKDVSTKDNLRDARLSAIIATRDYHSLAEFIRSGKDQETEVSSKRDRGKAKTKTKRRNTSPKEGSQTDKVDERPSPTASKTGKNPKDIPKRTPEWYAMAGDKLAVVVKSLVPLVTHEHYRVRKELAVLCYRIVSECSLTMQPSLTMALDVLISLSNDNYKEVAEYCSKSINSYFLSSTKEKRLEAVDSLCENFFTTLNCLPRILNNIDANRKYSALNLLHGYLCILCDGARPQRLTAALSPSDAFPRLCDALLAAAALRADLALLTRHAARDVTSPPPTDAPWRQLRHLDTKNCEIRFQQICQKFGEAESAELFLDRLLELFQERRSCELVYIMNFMGSAPNSSPELAKRLIATYTEAEVWHRPLELRAPEAPPRADTLDEGVYNPRAWRRDSVPGLYEGTVETRYTDISYAHPRIEHVDHNTCATLVEAQRNMAFCCLVTEGLGMMARRLKESYQPYLLKTLCLILERVGSKYENLHLAGLRAINDVAAAFGHPSVTDLIAENADYFTSQVTSRLKKAWDVQSALQILAVVMEYSDVGILDYLYGIVEDVLVQSCDKYYQNDLYAYLQVFLTFVNCIRKWFLTEPKPNVQTQNEIDILKDVIEYEKNKDKMERLLSEGDFERECGKSVEEMYKEDLKRREEDLLDYDDTVAPEAPPVPRHVTVTLTILKRCVHFIPLQRDESILALEILTLGLPIIKDYEDELLPLVHVIWAPLVGRFESEPPVLRKAFDLFVVLADVSKDFIRSRAVKEVLPVVYAYLSRAAAHSRLQDAGAAYRRRAAFALQAAALAALPRLAAALRLRAARLAAAAAAASPYLHRCQPKPLQMLAVKFFKDMLDYSYGCTWQHLRRLCANAATLCPPAAPLRLHAVAGTPYETTDGDYDANIKLIFYVHK